MESRLALARGVLRQAERRQVEQRSEVPGSDGRMLPVAHPLARLLPGGGLRRGTTVAVPGGPAEGARRGGDATARARVAAPPENRPGSGRGRRGPTRPAEVRSPDVRSRGRSSPPRSWPASGTTSVLWGLVAAASAEGAWVGVVGHPELGAVAAAEAGVRLERVALVPDAGGDLLAVASALLDGLDIIVVAGLERAHLGPADRERLAARARQRGAVLIAFGPWPGADVQLSCAARWGGLGTDGSGRLREREIVVRAQGRGIAPAGREIRLLLPGAGGAAPAASGSAGWAPVASVAASAASGSSGSGSAGWPVAASAASGAGDSGWATVAPGSAVARAVG